MKPAFQNSDKAGYFRGKRDQHPISKNHRKLGMWYEAYERYTSRSTLKQKLRKLWDGLLKQ